jgi:hypothetical protein
MTLLLTVFAAVISTAVWYKGEGKSEMKIGILCWMFWGASLMWFVDAVFQYAGDPAAYFKPDAASMLNDLFLGLSVIALALVIWIVIVLVRDPKGVVKSRLFRK